jgi:hypothetical protein
MLQTNEPGPVENFGQRVGFLEREKIGLAVPYLQGRFRDATWRPRGRSLAIDRMRGFLSLFMIPGCRYLSVVVEFVLGETLVRTTGMAQAARGMTGMG